MIKKLVFMTMLCFILNVAWSVCNDDIVLSAKNQQFLIALVKKSHFFKENYPSDAELTVERFYVTPNNHSGAKNLEYRVIVMGRFQSSATAVRPNLSSYSISMPVGKRTNCYFFADELEKSGVLIS